MFVLSWSFRGGPAVDVFEDFLGEGVGHHLLQLVDVHATSLIQYTTVLFE